MNQYRNDRDPNDLIFQFKKRPWSTSPSTPTGVHDDQAGGKSTTSSPLTKGTAWARGTRPTEGVQDLVPMGRGLAARQPAGHSRALHAPGSQRDGGGRQEDQEGAMIFPRYHQLDAVRKLESACQSEGAGANYLVMHSAGSGKSNSISWLAHRLSNCTTTMTRRFSTPSS